MQPLTGNSSVDLECGGQDIPLPCPIALPLPSAPVAPPEVPTLVEGAIVFDSWAAVISESAVMTIQNAAGNDWTDTFRRNRSQYSMC